MIWKIISKIKTLQHHQPINVDDQRFSTYYKRATSNVLNIGGDNVPIIVSASNISFENNGSDYVYVDNLDNYNEEQACIIPSDLWCKHQKNNSFPYFASLKEYRQSEIKSDVVNFISLNKKTITNSIMGSMS